VLTLTSFSASATLAEWQAALRVVTYADSSASPSTSNRTISFVANDAINNGNVAIKTVSVSAIGNAPVVTASGGTTAYIENGAALTIDGALTVSDADSSTLASVAVSISANFAAGEDLLAFANDGSTMGNVAGGYNAASGVLTLSSSGATATLAEWQAALRAVTYANSSDNPSTNNRSISFVANDGTASSTASIKTVSVAAVNDAPVVSSSAGTTAYSENGAPVAVDGALTVSDADSATLASVTVSISANFATGEDLLAFANDGSTMGNVASGYNATTGVLTLSSSGGTATLAQWQAALRAVTYANNSDNPSTAGRILTFIANDGAFNSTPAAKTVSVAAVNDAPVVTTSGGSTAYTENGAAAAIDASIAVADVDSTTLANVNVSIITNLAAGEDLLAFINNGSTMGNIVGSYNGGSGLLALTSSGATATLAEWQSALRAVTYANSADNPSTSNRSISFVASDGTAGSASSTEAVSVAAVNDAPVVSSSAGTTAYSENGAPVAIDGALTVSDADSATLTSVSVSIGINFAAGEDLLAFTNDGSTMGNVAGSYNAGTGVLTLTSSGATATLAQWQAALRSVSYANSSDNPSTSGRVLSFVANDGTSSSAAAAKTVGVSAVNDPPFVTMSAGTLAYAGNGAVLAIDGALTVSDADTNTLANVSVSISANFASGEDVLAFTNDGSSMGDLTASYNAGSGVLTLSSPGGGATLVQWQAALRAVTFSTSASDGGAASRTIRFAVSDGAPASPPSIATLQIQLSTVVQVTWAAPGTEAGLPIAQTISTTPDARNETPFAAAPAAKATGPSQPAQATQDATEALARNPALPLHRIALLLSTPTASAEVRWRDEAQAASGSDTRFAFFDELLLPAERDGGSGAPAFNTAAYSTLSHRARNRHGEDEQPDATGNIEQQETSATLVKKSAALIAGATTLWSLRLSGLLASLFASRPLWTHLDPIPLLPPAQDEPEPLPQEAGDEEAAKDEVAAAQLLHDVAPGGRAS
jgi:hypothetical protein